MVFLKPFVSAVGIIASTVSAQSGDVADVTPGPCDIYGTGNTPCVAAHSTTRALYKAFSGPLYQVIRGSDKTTLDISPHKAGGPANGAAQDDFCASTTCLISIIYDQSGKGNHLRQAPKGGFSGPDVNGTDNLASAIGAPVKIKGKKAYGVFIHPGAGYRIDYTNGVATGNQAEGLYAVMDGTHYNAACCFDYGNAEVSNTDTGATHMEAIYLGTSKTWGYGTGNGPWVMADLENNLFSGQATRFNNESSSTSRFVTAVVKGNSSNLWSIRAGNGQAGNLQNQYVGIRPTGYYPMNKEGSIILGIGGDNSNGAQGTFYEGVMTSGYPTDDIENQVQANIVAQNYKIAPLVSGPKFTVGSNVTFRVTTPGYDTRYIAHTGQTVNTQVINSANTSAVQNTALWTVRTGLGNSGCYSFESVDTPGSYIRHFAFELYVQAGSGQLYNEDATFCPEAGLNGQGSSIRSWSYATRFWRHFSNLLYIADEGGLAAYSSAYSYNNDVSFVVAKDFEKAT